MPAGKLPTRPVAATCPNCRSRFMYRPAAAAASQEAGEGDAGKPRYRDDLHLIKAEVVSFYADMFGRHRSNFRFIALLLVLYGLMYFIVTSIYYLRLKSGGKPVAGLAEYLLIAGSYVIFFPVMVMHSWKFTDTGSGHLVDRVFGHRAIFAAVTASYIVLLLVNPYFFGAEQVPLSLLVPVIASSLVPSLLHVLTDSL